jgi:hypothetical protein
MEARYEEPAGVGDRETAESGRPRHVGHGHPDEEVRNRREGLVERCQNRASGCASG